MLSFQTENGSRAIFLNLFTVCSACKRKFVIYPFANGLNRLNGLAHLCIIYICTYIDVDIYICVLPFLYIYKYIWKTELTQSASSTCLLQMEIGNGN